MWQNEEEEEEEEEEEVVVAETAGPSLYSNSLS